MDSNRLIEIFKYTIDPIQRKNAEAQLEVLVKIAGFVPSVLQLVMNNNVEMTVRQAAAIYLKQAIATYWSEVESFNSKIAFQIYEQDKVVIRQSIVDAIVYAPELISSHLSLCLCNIIRNDFPQKWTGVVEKVNYYLQLEQNCWMGALLSLQQLVKFFEYKACEERKPLDDSMALLLPIIHQRFVELLHQESDECILIQKQILKVFYGFMQYSFPLKLLPNDVFTAWMVIFRRIVERPVPESVNAIDIDERANNCNWKCKKWVLHILLRVFDRYGSPKTVSKDLTVFATWYIETFSQGIIEVLLKILEQQGNKMYVPPRVLQLTLNYLTIAVTHSLTWKIIKPHMQLIIQKILFPLMCYTEEDAQLWENDPQEYIRMKFDIFEDYVSPVTAAQNLLYKCCNRRKDMLIKVLQFSVEILNQNDATPPMKDGALHMVGALADIMLKKNTYKGQLENMLVTYVFPFFQNPNGYLRARACCVLRYFTETNFQNENNLFQAYHYVYNCLINDNQLPVKVEAAICLQYLMTCQQKCQKVIERNITQIALEILKIIRETENEDLTNVMQKLVCLYAPQFYSISYEMTQHLEETFNKILEGYSDDDTDEKALTALGVLNTIDTILAILEDQTELMKQLEPIVIRVIVKIFSDKIVDLYEEASTLVCTITSNYISNEMWKIFEILYQVFKKGGFDCFSDMMPALHNFLTVNPQAFISNQNHILAIYDMCKTVMTNNSGEDAECHAAKLLECLILQFRGQIDNCIEPFVELVIQRLSKPIETPELRTMCLQILITALYYNEKLLYDILNKKIVPNTNQTYYPQFIEKWINNVNFFIGLHDRKICVLGLIKLITLPPEMKNPVIYNLSDKILPSILILFEGLKTAYQKKANSENLVESDVDDDDDDDDDDHNDFDSDDFELLDDDEDQSNNNAKLGSDEYFGDLKVSLKVNKNSMFRMTNSEICEEDEDEDEDNESVDDYDQTALESYSTYLDREDCPEDEYIIFKEVMENLQSNDPLWYNKLVGVLSNEQKTAINDVYTLALHRKAAAESKKIEKSGGYNFNTSQNVPLSFNFGNN